MAVSFAVALLLLVPACFAADGVVDKNGRVRYDGHSVVRVFANTTGEMRGLSKFQAELNLDVWSNDGNVGMGANDLRVTAAEFAELKKLRLTTKEYISDVQKLIDNEMASLADSNSTKYFATGTKAAPSPFYDNYNTYTSIVAYLSTLAQQYPDLCTFVPSVGQTIEGRNIPALLVGAAGATKQIFFSGGQHAREWVGPATTIFVTEQLLIDYETSVQVREILNNIRFVVVPLINGDGYNFAWTTNRLWRKNRRAILGSTFYGVDLNRNWNDHWGGQGSSPIPSSETYHGTGPFSEPESLRVSNYYTAQGPYNAAIDWHSYSQLILRPSGWTSVPSPDEALNKAVGDEMRDAIFDINGLSYTSQPSYALYYTTGGASDWYYGDGAAKLAFTIELRDTGAYGFVLPPAQIIPCGWENYAAVVYLGQFVLEI